MSFRAAGSSQALAPNASSTSRPSWSSSCCKIATFSCVRRTTSRAVSLFPDVVAQLWTHPAIARANPHGLVWHRANGSPPTNADDNDAGRAALAQAGVDRPTATTHWLRPSYTTLAEHAGIAHAAYAGVSGHGSEQASDPYRHPLTAEGERAVVALPNWLKESSCNTQDQSEWAAERGTPVAGVAPVGNLRVLTFSMMNTADHPMRGAAISLVLLNPSDIAGARTRARVAKLATLLDCREYQVLNLCAVASSSVIELRDQGAVPTPWLESRRVLEAGIRSTAHVVLAYGVRGPSGPAGSHFRDQVAWLQSHLSTVGATVWTVGGSPRHPSRWQRYTHRHLPDVAFDDALVLSLRANAPALLGS